MFLLVLLLMFASQRDGLTKSTHPATKHKPVSAAAKPTKKQSELSKTVWDASRTKGEVALSYAAAKADPELLANLFCYCGCDVSENMPSLLRCFQTDHSVDCSICREEALLAHKLKKEGKSLSAIQKEVDRRYGYLYPFPKDSELLRKYKQNRKYGDAKAIQDAGIAGPQYAEINRLRDSKK